MMRSGVRPNRLTLPFVLKSAAALLFARLRRALHRATVGLGLEFDAFFRVLLVDKYSKVELLNFALQVFNESPERIKLVSVLLWNVLIYGYCKVGKLLFEALPERNVGSWNCLINGYMRKGKVIRAGELFDQMLEENVVSWTTMIAALLAILRLEIMRRPCQCSSKCWKKACLISNDHTVVSVLSACAKLRALDLGVRI